MLNDLADIVLLFITYFSNSQNQLSQTKVNNYVIINPCHGTAVALFRVCQLDVLIYKFDSWVFFCEKEHYIVSIFFNRQLWLKDTL